MLKKWITILFALAMAASFAACQGGQRTDTTTDNSLSGAAVSESTGRDGYTFEDAAGAQITLPAKPEKVAVLFSSLADVWQTAGGEVAITVGESVERGFVPEGTPLVDGGAGKTINQELLLSYEPDFVICRPIWKNR